MLIISFDMGIKNLSYCVFNKNTCSVVEWDNISIIPSENKVKSYTIDKILDKLFKSLDNINLTEKYGNEIESIFIENQPTKNPKMKNIQIGTFSYYIIKNEFNYKVKLISSKNKLKFNEVKEIDEILYKSKQKYTQRKKLAIQLCNLFIKKYNFDNIKDFFVTSKKKDDLADSFLYCMYIYLNLNNF